MSGKIDLQKAKESLAKFNGLKGMDLAIKVTTNEPYEWTEGRKNIYGSNKATKLQSGYIFDYAFVMLLGFSLLLTFFIIYK